MSWESPCETLIENSDEGDSYLPHRLPLHPFLQIRSPTRLGLGPGRIEPEKQFLSFSISPGQLFHSTRHQDRAR